MRRIAILLVLVIVVTVIALAFVRNRPGVNKDNFDRIEIGMSKEDVMAILGRDNITIVPNEHSRLLPGYVEYNWVGLGELALVIFDEHDRVEWKQWSAPRRNRVTLFDWIRAAIGWREPIPG